MFEHKILPKQTKAGEIESISYKWILLDLILVSELFVLFFLTA
jgi:hypothetical protein